jgi:type I restriction-modification system DNA methylase subunit
MYQDSLFDNLLLAGSGFRIGIGATATAKQRQQWNADALRVLERIQAEQRGATFEEKVTLAKYSATGGIGNSLNEFYTPEELGRTLWTILERIHPIQSVLEPSAGTGILIQDAPTRAKVTAVELDRTSSSILGLLSPNSNVTQSSFERWHLANLEARFDAVIGNPPFGVRMEDVILDEPNLKEASRYFLTRAIDHLKPDGVLAMVLPSGIAANKTDLEFRTKILARASVLGVYGLPNSTFERVQCEVATTDVWFLRRHPKPLETILTTIGEHRHWEMNDVFAMAGLEHDSFLEGRILKDNPERIYGAIELRPFMGGQIQVRIGHLVNAIAGMIDESKNWRYETGQINLNVHELLARLKEIPNLQRPIRAIERSFANVIPRDTLRWNDEKLEVYRNQWIELPIEVTAAYRDGEKLEALLEFYQRAKGQNDWETQQSLRQQVKGLLEAFLEQHGQPSVILDSAGERARFKHLESALFEGAVSDEYREDPQSKQQEYDFSDITQVVAWLRKYHLPTTLENISQKYQAKDAAFPAPTPATSNPLALIA